MKLCGEVSRMALNFLRRKRETQKAGSLVSLKEALHCVMSQWEGLWQISVPCYWTPQPLVMKTKVLFFVHYQNAVSSCSDRPRLCLFLLSTSLSGPQKSCTHKSWVNSKKDFLGLAGWQSSSVDYFLFSSLSLSLLQFTISSFDFRLSSVLCST